MKITATSAKDQDFKVACKALFSNYIRNTKTKKCYVLDPHQLLGGGMYRICYVNPQESPLVDVFDDDSIDCIKYFNKQLKSELNCIGESYEEISEKEYLDFVFPEDNKKETQNGKVIQTKTYEFSESQLKRMDKAIKTGKPQ